MLGVLGAPTALSGGRGGSAGAPRAVPEDPEEHLPLHLGSQRHFRVLGCGGTWGTWCPQGPRCHRTWQHPTVPWLLKAPGCSHLGDPSRVSPAQGTPPALSLGSEPRLGPRHPQLPAVPWGNRGTEQHEGVRPWRVAVLAAPLLCHRGAGSGSARAQRCHLSSLVSEGWRARRDEAAP